MRWEGLGKEMKAGRMREEDKLRRGRGWRKRRRRRKRTHLRKVAE